MSSSDCLQEEEDGRGEDVDLKTQKWVADKRGLSAFKSTKVRGRSRGAGPTRRAATTASSYSPEETHPVHEQLTEDPADTLARLASESLSLDGLGEWDSPTRPAKAVHQNAAVSASEVHHNAHAVAAVLGRKVASASSDDIGSPDLFNSDGSPKWQAVASRPLEHLLFAAQRNSTARLLRQIDGDQEDGGDDALAEEDDVLEDGERLDAELESAAGGSSSRFTWAAAAPTVPQRARSDAGSGERGHTDDGVNDVEDASPGGARPYLAALDSAGSASEYDGMGEGRGSIQAARAPITSDSGMGLANPDLQMALLRLRSAEERLKTREAVLAVKEAAVAQLDARQRVVHQLRQQLDERDHEVKRRESVLAGREARFDNELRAASGTERARLARLIEEGETLVRKLKVEIPAREEAMKDAVGRLQEELSAREAGLAPRLACVEAREAASAEEARAAVRVMEAKQAELVAAMITARDLMGSRLGGRSCAIGAGVMLQALPLASAAEPEESAKGRTEPDADPLFSVESDSGRLGQVPGLGAAQAAVMVEGLRQGLGSGEGAGTNDAVAAEPPHASTDPLGWLTDRIAYHSAALAVSRKATEQAEAEMMQKRSSGVRPVRRAPPSIDGSSSAQFRPSVAQASLAGFGSPSGSLPSASRRGALVGGSVAHPGLGGMGIGSPLGGGWGGLGNSYGPSAGLGFPSLSATVHTPLAGGTFRSPGLLSPGVHLASQQAGARSMALRVGPQASVSQMGPMASPSFYSSSEYEGVHDRSSSRDFNSMEKVGARGTMTTAIGGSTLGSSVGAAAFLASFASAGLPLTAMGSDE